MPPLHAARRITQLGSAHSKHMDQAQVLEEEGAMWAARAHYRRADECDADFTALSAEWDMGEQLSPKEQIAQDTCAEHNVFCCPSCFDMGVPSDEPSECTDGASPEEHRMAIESMGQCPWCGATS